MQRIGRRGRVRFRGSYMSRERVCNGGAPNRGLGVLSASTLNVRGKESGFLASSSGMGFKRFAKLKRGGSLKEF